MPVYLDDVGSLSNMQCLYGYTPFACENRHDTKLKILVSSGTNESKPTKV